MARILIGLYNGLYSEETPLKFACWYDGLIRGLSDGNELDIWQIKEFGKKETFFSEEDKEKIRAFSPDLALSFNNVLPKLGGGVADCPEIVIIVDSLAYITNKS